MQAFLAVPLHRRPNSHDNELDEGNDVKYGEEGKKGYEGKEGGDAMRMRGFFSSLTMEEPTPLPAFGRKECACGAPRTS